MSSNEIPVVVGYDGQPYTKGDRVECHPDANDWPLAAKVSRGTVIGIGHTQDDRVRVEFDRIPGRLFCGPAERFRKL